MNEHTTITAQPAPRKNQRFLLVWITVLIIVGMCLLGYISVVNERNANAAMLDAITQAYPTPIPYYEPGHYYP